jgi:hypothetical protein
MDHTGRLTSEAMHKRGPRICLTSVYDDARFVGFVIRREGDEGTVINPTARLKFQHLIYRSFAKSYSLRYLLRIGRQHNRRGRA